MCIEITLKFRIEKMKFIFREEESFSEKISEIMILNGFFRKNFGKLCIKKNYMLNKQGL